MVSLKFLLLTILALTAASRPMIAATDSPSSTSPRETFSFNPGWKFIRENVAGAEQVEFNDSAWAEVSAPHTYNDSDSFAGLASHSGGDRDAWTGTTWYRKRFRLPTGAENGKVFLEFEGLKQAGRFWVNGKFAGRFENGITACGLDLTGLINPGGEDNVIAVKVDNSSDYREEATGVSYQWTGRAFNPNYGGLNRNIWLHLTGKIYQTLPLYENLKTSGTYVYPTGIDIKDKTCDVNVESQVRNESDAPSDITLSVAVMDASGTVRAEFKGAPQRLESGQTEIFKASGRLTGVKFWSDTTPDLYKVVSTLTVNGKVVDARTTWTGFRKTEFKGGAGTGGVYLNDQFVYLTGYAQRSTNDWAGLGQAYPDWMHDYNADLVRSSHANHIRWMHIAPQAADVRACDKAGIIQTCPAGDKEKDPVLDPRLPPEAAARQWDQRMEVMRATLIYFRNSPSILFWEAGNNTITTEHLRQMVALRKELDPQGGRTMGCRSLAEPESSPIAEYFGVMAGQDKRTDALKTSEQMFRAYSAERRDLAPMIETEDFRDEAARRFWDDSSPPHFGFKKGLKDAYSWNSETFCLAAAERYHAYAINKISNPDPARSKWSGYASIYWSDSNADGRQESSEVCRVSGKVDSVRLPKQAYYLYRVMQNPSPDIHLIGHWNYPAETVKSVFVAANHCDSVELLVNGVSLGQSSTPRSGFLFEFPAVKFIPGKVAAVAMANGKVVARHEIETAGDAKRLKLTPHTGPDGLLADGSDVVFYDVEVVDAAGRRCPTDEARVDFKLEGPATWRGGYNSGKAGSVNNLWLDTECGINRVAIRSTMNPGSITLAATRTGLEPATVEIKSKPVKISSGLAGTDHSPAR